MQLVRLWGAFTKVVEESDGTLRVEGVASSDTKDTQGETVRPSAIEKAIPGYLRKDGSGPLREMHQPIAAGKTTAIDVQPDGKTYIVTKVVDASTILKVREKVLQGFSIGGYVPPGGRNKDDPKVIESIVLQEISLVDRPANPDAVVTVFKVDGATNGDPLAPSEDRPADQPAPAPANPPAKAPVTPGVTVPPAAPPTVSAPAPPTPLEQPPTTIVPPPSSPSVPSPVPGAPATTPSVPPPSSPPSPPPLPPAEKVAKGMYSVQWAAELISGLTSLVSDVTWETNFEDDGSTIPARLKALCTELVAIFQDLVAEETAELVATMPNIEQPVQVVAALEKPGALKKSERLAGIARSFAAAAKGEKAPDSKAALRDAVAKAIDELRAADVPASELQKTLDIANEAAAKAGEALKKVQGERDAIAKQLAEANVKLATKGALKVVAVEKKNDGGTGADEDLEKLSPEEQIKKIHAKGGVPYGRAPLS